MTIPVIRDGEPFIVDVGGYRGAVIVTMFNIECQSIPIQSWGDPIIGHIPLGTTVILHCREIPMPVDARPTIPVIVPVDGLSRWAKLFKPGGGQ